MHFIGSFIILMHFYLDLPFKSQLDRESILFDVSRVTHGFVPTDLQNLCAQVILLLVNENGEQVHFDHFERALGSVRPSNLNEFASKVKARRREKWSEQLTDSLQGS